ncbi:MAG: NAD-dependent epimerase/dehydratase family protein [Candidatus Coatesbacteria bacterium]
MDEQDLKDIATGLGAEARALEGKTLLLTGSGGFLGRWFVRAVDHLNAAVLAKPCRLLALDTVEAAKDIREGVKRPGDITFIHHDLSVGFDFKDHVDFAVHMAGIASPAYYRAKPLETLDVSFLGTRQVLDLAKRDGARMLCFSSSEIYGDPDPKFVPTPETYRGYVSSMGPRSCYDEGKRVCETLCYIYANYFQVAAVVVRPFNVYGPEMKEKDYRVLPNFASAIKADRPLLMYGNGKQTRTYCYATDGLVGFFRALLKGRGGEAYNIGNTNPEISINDLVAVIEKVLGRTVKKEFAKYPDHYPPDEPSRRCPDLTKAKTELGYAPRTPLEEGLRRYLAWTDRHYTGAS